MIPNAIIDKLSKAFNITQEIVSDSDQLTLVTRSHIGDKVVYEHRFDLDVLVDALEHRLEKRQK